MSLPAAAWSAGLPAGCWLYLPKERAADDERREQAELHKETGFQTKPEVALDGIRGMEIVLETTECA